MKYHCKIFITENAEDGGVWEVTRTSKRVTFELLEGRPFYNNRYVYAPPEETKKGTRICRHHLLEWEDGDMTLYPDRNGVPFLFKPLCNPQ